MIQSDDPNRRPGRTFGPEIGIPEAAQVVGGALLLFDPGCKYLKFMQLLAVVIAELAHVSLPIAFDVSGEVVDSVEFLYMSPCWSRISTRREP